MNLAYVHPNQLTMHWKYRIYQLMGSLGIKSHDLGLVSINCASVDFRSTFVYIPWMNKTEMDSMLKKCIATLRLYPLQCWETTTKHHKNHYNKLTKCTAVCHLLCISNNAWRASYTSSPTIKDTSGRNAPLHSETLRKFTTQLKNSLRCQRHNSAIL